MVYEIAETQVDLRDRVVVVDDDATMVGLLADVLGEEGYLAEKYTDPRAAARAIIENPPSLVITDLRMGGFDGMTLLEQVVAAHPAVPVILVTAFGSVDTAIEATRKGAYHFITKPFRLREVLLIVERAIGHRRVQKENESLRRQIDTRYQFGGLIGKSAAMHQVFDLIERVAAASSNVLVLGESGTGKELVARAIHRQSPRKAAPFVALNCSALPEGLLESELFGHVRGAFTGAHANKAGLFQEASGGTLFLDEIGDMPLSLQAKVLRAIQEKVIRPVGGNREVAVDTRIIAATHQDLREHVRQGKFREDLYYRLSVIPLPLPPLRDRAEDIPLLVSHFTDQIARGLGVAPKPIDHTALQHLMRLPWEGNVRELQNVIERAQVLCRSNVIRVADLPDAPSGADPEMTLPPVPRAPEPVLPALDEPRVEVAEAEAAVERAISPSADVWPTLAEVERRYFIEVLKHVHGNQEKASEVLGVDRRTLYRWRSRHNLDALIAAATPRDNSPDSQTK